MRAFLKRLTDGLWSRRPFRAKPETVLALAAIFKNEGPYVLEWVAYHRLLGVERFFIADNGGDDDMTPLLAALDRAGIVSHIPFPGVPGEPPQLAAYRLILDRHRTAAEWFAFIDADEFILPTGKDRDLPGWLSRLPRKVGAVALNWATYGSSGRDRPGDGLVNERFTIRHEEHDPGHRHYKTILRAEAFVATSGNPHHFEIAPRWRCVDANGDLLRGLPGQSGMSESVVWGHFRLQHFLLKSKSEYVRKKMARGRATRFDQPRTMRQFEQFDRPGVEDPASPDMLAALRTEVAWIRTQIADLPEAIRDMDLRIDQLGPSPPPKVAHRMVKEQLAKPAGP